MEHAVHTWDVAVALDPAATVAPDAVGLLVDTLGQFMGRAAKPDGVERRLRVSTTDPERFLHGRNRRSNDPDQAGRQLAGGVAIFFSYELISDQKLQRPVEANMRQSSYTIFR